MTELIQKLSGVKNPEIVTCKFNYNKKTDDRIL